MARTKDEHGRGAFRPIRLRCRTAAPPAVVYELLVDLRSHVVWGGEQQSAGFRLLTLEAPEGPAVAGTEFRSTGTDGKHRVNHDRSVVTEASSPAAFEFVTDSRSVRADDGATAMSSTVVHRYEIRSAVSGSDVTYTWQTARLEPVWAIFRIPVASWVILRIMRSMLRKGFTNLLAMAEQRAAAPVAA